MCTCELFLLAPFGRRVFPRSSPVMMAIERLSTHWLRSRSVEALKTGEGGGEVRRDGGEGGRGGREGGREEGGGGGGGGEAKRSES